MDVFNVLLLGFVSFTWSIQPFIIKAGSQKSISMFIALKSIFVACVMFLLSQCIFMVKLEKCKDIAVLAAIGASFSIFSKYGYGLLLKKNNPALISAIAYPASLILTLMLGNFLQKERIMLHQYIGIVLAVVSCVLICIKK